MAVLVVALVVPLGVTAALLWVRAGKVSTPAQAERDGVTYLRPLVRLLAEATDQQSLDVAGTPGTGDALRAAIAKVDAVDASLGVQLGAHDRWTNVRRRLGALIETPPADGSAYQSFVPVVDQIIALIGVIGDRSTLILDPDLDTYYLMDVTLIRLPAILVSAGRLSDRGQTRVGVTSPEAAVLADQIRRQSTALDTSVRKSFAATRNDAVTTGLVPDLDQFNDAVTTLTPPSADVGGVADSGIDLLVDRNRLRDTALALEDDALTQLDLLLKARRDAAEGQRWLVVGLLFGALLVATPAIWVLGRRSVTRPDRGMSPSPRDGTGSRYPDRGDSWSGTPPGDFGGLVTSPGQGGGTATGGGR